MNKRFIYSVATGLILTIFVINAFAQNTSNKNMDKTSGNFQLPPLKIEQYTLENGLRVVLNQDNSVPVVAVAVYYDVGSRNERAGRTGFAHLFEHMMFQGSENIKKAEHFQFISKA